MFIKNFEGELDQDQVCSQMLGKSRGEVQEWLDGLLENVKDSEEKLMLEFHAQDSHNPALPLRADEETPLQGLSQELEGSHAAEIASNHHGM
jgi:hypothetical protein